MNCPFNAAGGPEYFTRSANFEVDSPKYKLGKKTSLFIRGGFPDVPSKQKERSRGRYLKRTDQSFVLQYLKLLLPPRDYIHGRSRSPRKTE